MYKYVLKRQFTLKKNDYQIHQQVALLFSENYSSSSYSYSYQEKSLNSGFEYKIMLVTDKKIPRKLFYKYKFSFEILQISDCIDINVSRCLFRITVFQVYNTRNPLLIRIIEKYNLKNKYKYEINDNRTIYITPNTKIDFITSKYIQKVNKEDYLQLIFPAESSINYQIRDIKIEKSYSTYCINSQYNTKEMIVASFRLTDKSKEYKKATITSLGQLNKVGFGAVDYNVVT